MCLLYVLWVFGVKTWAHGLYLSACAWQVVEHTLTASSIKTEGLTQHCGTNKYHPTTVSSPHFSPTLIWPLFSMCSTQSCISTLQQRDQTLQEVDAFKVSWNNDCKPSSNFPFYLLLHSTADVCTSFPHIKTGNALAWHHVDTMYVSQGFAESSEPVSYLSMTTTHTNRKYSPSEAVSACHLLVFITCLSSRFATLCFVLLLNWICPIRLCYCF